jgi:hypothetical protein
VVVGPCNAQIGSVTVTISDLTSKFPSGNFSEFMFIRLHMLNPSLIVHRTILVSHVAIPLLNGVGENLQDKLVHVMLTNVTF